MQRSRGFTLIEIIIAVAILLVVLMMAVPSFEGVLRDRKLRASLDEFNKLVREAQERSVNEHRAYLIVWGNKDIFVQPEAFKRDEDEKPVANFVLEQGSALTLTLPAALTAKPAGEWILADGHVRAGDDQVRRKCRHLDGELFGADRTGRIGELCREIDRHRRSRFTKY